MKQLTQIDNIIGVLDSMIDASEPTEQQQFALLYQALATAHVAKQTQLQTELVREQWTEYIRVVKSSVGNTLPVDYFQPLTPDEAVVARRQPETWQDEVRADRLADQMLENLRHNVGEQKGRTVDRIALCVQHKNCYLPAGHEKCKTCGKGIGGVCSACHCYCPSVPVNCTRHNRCQYLDGHLDNCRDSGGIDLIIRAGAEEPEQAPEPESKLVDDIERYMRGMQFTKSQADRLRHLIATRERIPEPVHRSVYMEPQPDL